MARLLGDQFEQRIFDIAATLAPPAALIKVVAKRVALKRPTAPERPTPTAPEWPTPATATKSPVKLLQTSLALLLEALTEALTEALATPIVALTMTLALLILLVEPTPWSSPIEMSIKHCILLLTIYRDVLYHDNDISS